MWSILWSYLKFDNLALDWVTANKSNYMYICCYLSPFWTGYLHKSLISYENDYFALYPRKNTLLTIYFFHTTEPLLEVQRMRSRKLYRAPLHHPYYHRHHHREERRSIIVVIVIFPSHRYRHLSVPSLSSSSPSSASPGTGASSTSVYPWVDSSFDKKTKTDNLKPVWNVRNLSCQNMKKCDSLDYDCVPNIAWVASRLFLKVISRYCK